MGKDPAVLFYPGDFLVGIIGLSDEQVGRYIKLLCIQHQKGHLTEAIVLDICDGVDEDIMSKFETDADGKYFNVRMEEEKIKRQNYCSSRSKNRTKKPSEDMLKTSSTYVPHMENESETESEVKKVVGNHLLKNSTVTIHDITDAFSKADDLKNADASYYWNAAQDWSANGNMRKDWIATLRSFARRDIRDGKLKLSSHRQEGGSNLSSGDKFVPTPVSETAMTHEEYLAQKSKNKQDED